MALPSESGTTIPDMPRTPPIALRLKPDLRDRVIEKADGNVNAYIRGLIEADLNGEEVGGEKGSRGTASEGAGVLSGPAAPTVDPSPDTGPQEPDDGLDPRERRIRKRRDELMAKTNGLGAVAARQQATQQVDAEMAKENS